MTVVVLLIRPDADLAWRAHTLRPDPDAALRATPAGILAPAGILGRRIA